MPLALASGVPCGSETVVGVCVVADTISGGADIYYVVKFTCERKSCSKQSQHNFACLQEDEDEEEAARKRRKRSKKAKKRQQELGLA